MAFATLGLREEELLDAIAKTAERRLVPFTAQGVANMAAAFQEAIVDTIVLRTLDVMRMYKARAVVMGGGVASNTLLREQMAARLPIEVIVPRPALCTDNGAMIGAAGYFRLRDGLTHQWDLDVVPNLRLG